MLVHALRHHLQRVLELIRCVGSASPRPIGLAQQAQLRALYLVGYVLAELAS
jgi:hypothetical protein